MKIRKLTAGDLDRIERAYLASLRVAILGVATLCLLGAIFFGLNAAWRVVVSTDVEQKPVQVTGAQVAAELKKAAPESRGPEGANEIPAQTRQAHARWVRDVLPGYYAVYRTAAQAYKKPEDELLTSQQLMDALGYDLQNFADDNEKATAFILNTDYQQQALAAVTAAMSDTAVVSQLAEYKAAEKTAKSCNTTYERRSAWDPYSTACYNWFQYPQGCQVTRSVPVERCVPAYPEGIVSPRVAFGRADQEFFRLWTQQSEQVRAEAQSTRDERAATRAQIGPNLLLALQVLGAFLVIMFFFLVVAIERHLRAGAVPASGGDAAGPSTDDADPESKSEPSPQDSAAIDPPDDDPPQTPRWARKR
jgi:hypothetical protein